MCTTACPCAGTSVQAQWWSAWVDIIAGGLEIRGHKRFAFTKDGLEDAKLWAERVWDSAVVPRYKTELGG